MKPTGLRIVALLWTMAAFQPAPAQVAARTPAQPEQPFTLNVSVDEVSVPFHAADFNGVPMDDLAQADIRLLDNGKPPRRIVSFEPYRNLPVHMGILMDTSRSVLADLRRNRFIAGEYLQLLFHSRTDTAFIQRFDSQAKILQDWTGDKTLLAQTLAQVASDANTRLGGTAIFDAIYRACRDQFAKSGPMAAGSFILLFSDGIDNASHARLEDDVTICQATNTAIYVFSSEPKAILSPGEGEKTLRALTTQTGGHIFFEQQRDGIESGLRLIDANMRNQYRIVYQPQRLKPDGAFHHLKLTSPNRGGVLTARSGYYAPHKDPAHPGRTSP